MGDGFNIVDDLNDKHVVPGPGGGSVFSFYVTDGDDSEVTFGGYRPERLASDIVWAPVRVQSWWQVAIDDITFNNQPKNLCDGGCQVAVDTGTSMLAGPSDLVDKLSTMVAAKEDCSNFNSLPNLGFQIGEVVLNLRPEDYMDKSDQGCSISLMGLDVPPPKGPVFIFGDPFLRRFVTIYDRSKPAVGFAVAKREGDSTHGLIARVGGGAPPKGQGAENGNPYAVNLHLSAGDMTGGSGAGGGDDAAASASSSDSAPPAASAVEEAVPEDTSAAPVVATTAAPADTTSFTFAAAEDSSLKLPHFYSGDESATASGSGSPPKGAFTATSSEVSSDNIFSSKDPMQAWMHLDDQANKVVSMKDSFAATDREMSAVKKEEDAVLEMRKLLRDGFLIQKAKRSFPNLVSVKLFRTSGPAAALQVNHSLRVH